MIKSGALVVGLIIFLIGIVIMFFVYVTAFGPNPTASISANGVPLQPGSQGYKNVANIFMGIGVIIALIGIIISLIAVFKPDWINTSSWSQPWGAGPYPDDRYNQNPNSANFQQQQPADYSDIDNILASSPRNRDYSTSNPMKVVNQPSNDYEDSLNSSPAPSYDYEDSSNSSPAPSNDYSESFDSSYQSTNDYSDSFYSSTPSSGSDKICSFCGGKIDPKEKFCSNCGKRL